MTYEIALYPRRPGQDWAEVVAADQQDSPPMDQAQLDAGVSTFRRIEARLREQLTEPLEVWVAEETDGDVLGELTATASGLQVELYDRSAAVSFPTGSADGRARLHDQVRRAVRVVATETGYEAYDPQTGRTYDGLFDDGHEPASWPEEADLDGGAATVPGTAGPSGAPAASTSSEEPESTSAPTGPVHPLTDPRLDPRMLRRRAILYLVVGAALLVFSFLRMNAGETNWVTWLFLGFAGFNLIAGWMMRGLAAQAEQRRAEPPGEETSDGT